MVILIGMMSAENHRTTEMNIDTVTIKEIAPLGVAIIDAMMLDREIIVIARTDTAINTATIKTQRVSKIDSSKIDLHQHSAKGV